MTIEIQIKKRDKIKSLSFLFLILGILFVMASLTVLLPEVLSVSANTLFVFGAILSFFLGFIVAEYFFEIKK